MKLTIAELAEILKGKVVGEENTPLYNLAKIEEAQKGDISFISNPKYLPWLYKTKASVVIIDSKQDYDAKKIKNVKYLAQGTLYPDLIESKSVTGSQTSKIKSHHNVGGLPKDLKFDVIEPFRELFKDEVRRLGLFYKLDEKFINRHPFPGPGLAIRIPGEIDKNKIDILQRE